MSTSDDIADLEKTEKELKAKIVQLNNQRKIAHAILDQNQGSLELERQQAVACHGNLLHMQRSNLVDMGEWKTIRGNYLDAKDNLSAAHMAIMQADTGIKALGEQIRTISIELETVQNALASYGQVEQFPNKKVS
jgi:CO dehydrogenase/acetyl-CoA synthase epsilon subunit